MKKSILSVLFAIVICFNGYSQIRIIPKPTKLVENKGFYSFSNTLRIYTDYNGETPNFNLSEIIHRNIVDKHRNFYLYIENKIPQNKNGIFLRINKNLKELGDEGYKLSVTTKKIEITSYTAKGIFYGIQSFLQLLPGDYVISSEWSKGAVNIPCVEITDIPHFKWRGMLLDCCRHFMDKDFVKRYIDLLSYYKMNTFHWHLTEDQGWRIEIKKYPKLTEIGAWRIQPDGSRYGGYYTQNDIKEIVAYAAERYVNIVPEIEMPGHSVAAIASYPYLSCTGNQIPVETQWGVFKDIYCAGNDSTFIFLKDVLSEVINLFPYEYIHIGGDEAPKYRWERCDKCRKRIIDKKLKDEHELQSWFIDQINQFLKEKGRKLVGWDEILEGGLSKGATVQSWRGTEGAVEAARKGNYAVVSPTSHAYFDYDISVINLEKVYSFDPIPSELNEKERMFILGGECNMWTEYAPQDKVDFKVFPRLLSMSEVLWTYTDKSDFDEFRNRVQLQYPVLNSKGVKYGFEKEPLTVKSTVNKDNGEIKLELEKGQEGTEIYYELNSKKPSKKSAKYTNPIIKKDSLNINIAVLPKHSDEGYYYERSFKISKSTGVKPKFTFNYSKSYPAQGDNSLTDGILGTLNFRDGNWQGFEGNDMEVVLDLEKPQKINYISVGFLQSTPSWIFFPPKVDFFVSKNGVDYVNIGSVDSPESPKNTDLSVKRYKINIKNIEEYRFLKILAKNMGVCPDWHPGAGGKTWIFADEIIVE